MPKKRDGVTKAKKPGRSRQAAAFKGQRMSQAPKSAVSGGGGKGYGSSGNQRSEVARTFGPSVGKPFRPSATSAATNSASTGSSGRGSRSNSSTNSSAPTAAGTKPPPARGPSGAKDKNTPSAGKLPTASKSPNKETKREKAVGSKYKKLTAAARTTINGKKMSDAEVRKVKNARKELRAMRKKLTKRGYGSLDTEKNKAGGYSGHGIYKELTGKKMPPKKKKPTKPGR